MAPLPWQVVADCPSCRTDGAVLEVMDPGHPACALGVPVRATCRMCGQDALAEPTDLVQAHPFGSGRCPSCGEALSDASMDGRSCAGCGYTPAVVRTPGADVRDPAVARAALERWAAEEGLTLHELCAELGGPPDAVIARYTAGEPVSSGLDAVAFLFPGMAAGSSVGIVADVPAAQPRAPASVAVPPDPRAVHRLLASVMVGDGELRTGERAFVDRWLAKEGLDPLDPQEMRPWRPHEVGPVGDAALAERAIEAAVELMHLDGERDGSELRIVRTFARVWGVPEARVHAWNERYDRRYAPRLALVWRALSRWVRTR